MSIRQQISRQQYLSDHYFSLSEQPRVLLHEPTLTHRRRYLETGHIFWPTVDPQHW
jgi:hypothetical protein